MPTNFVETPDGLLLISDGMSPPLRWDGLKAEAEEAGVIKPTTGVTFGADAEITVDETTAATKEATKGVGVGGTYWAYLRFVDDRGNFSNLSPIAPADNADGSNDGYKVTLGSGTITSADEILDGSNTTINSSGVTQSVSAGMTITSAAHGLIVGQTITLKMFLVVTGDGSTYSSSTFDRDWEIKTADTDTFTIAAGLSSLNVHYFIAADSDGTRRWRVKGDTARLSYSAVQVPTEQKVVKRQILRNTDGQADTFYVDVETEDLTSTVFYSTRSDSNLAAQTAVPILTAAGKISANVYDRPPNHKLVMAHQGGRMFAAVDVPYSRGSCKVTYGSLTVTGVGTEWTTSMAGRFLYIVGETTSYEIDSVGAADTLTLLTAYTGTTDNFAVYTIKPAPAEKKQIYFSEAALPEAWPPTYVFSLQEDGDEPTGLMIKGSFVYIMERRHIYQFSFQSDPAVDGSVFYKAPRGCVNHRCSVVVEDTAYMLDEQGVHAYEGGNGSSPVSKQIQDVFRPNGTASHRINWAGAANFHAAHFQPQEVVRWFVCLSGMTLPMHALCYDYRHQRWWVEEFPFPITSSVVVTIGGQLTVLLASQAKKIFAMWQGTLDGPDPASGTVRGTATSSTLVSISDTAATFASSRLVGSPVAIVDGTGKNQIRIISAVSGTTITVTQPWMVLPSTDSVYQVGGIQWKYRTGHFQFLPDERESPRRIELVFEPTDSAATVDARILHDRSDTALTWSTDYTSDDHAGFKVIKDKPDLVGDLTKSIGFLQQRLDSRRELYIDGPRYVQLELAGVSNKDKITFYEIGIDGVLK